MMNRRQFLSRTGRAAVGTLAAMVAGRAARGASAERPPNILFILCDDLGWGDLHCYGHPVIQTPNLDRLARQGTLFTQFYVNSPVCSPSRATFMTGRFPARFRIHGHFAAPEHNASRGMPNWLDPKAVTVTRLLQEAGYATAHFGKWHLGGGPGAPDPRAYGIDVHRTLNSSGPGYEKEQKDPYFRAKSTRLFVEDAIRFIKAHRDRPWFVNLWTLVPHATLHPTDEDMKPYRRLAPALRLPYKGALQIYYGTVTALDRDLGRLLERLDELGLAENTLVVFSSDNGPEDIHIRNATHSGVGSPGPFRGRKRSLYEGGVRMPFIVRWPGHVPAGRVETEAVVTAVDFLPTVCRIAGASVPSGVSLDGEDVTDVLLGASRPRKRPIFWEWRFPIAGDAVHRSPMLAVRDGPWKLLMNPDRSRLELYHIPSDPTEVDNRAADHPGVVARLSEAALAWQKTLPKGPVHPAAGRVNYRWPGSRPAKGSARPWGRLPALGGRGRPPTRTPAGWAALETVAGGGYTGYGWASGRRGRAEGSRPSEPGMGPRPVPLLRVPSLVKEPVPGRAMRGNRGPRGGPGDPPRGVRACGTQGAEKG